MTYAVRDTKIDDKEIRQGDIMGIGDKGILAVGQGIEDITVETLKEMVDEDTSVISIRHGADGQKKMQNSYVSVWRSYILILMWKSIRADSRFITTWFP